MSIESNHTRALSIISSPKTEAPEIPNGPPKSNRWTLWQSFCDKLKWLIDKIKDIFCYCLKKYSSKGDLLIVKIDKEINEQIVEKDNIKNKIKILFNFINSRTDLREMCQKELSDDSKRIDVDAILSCVKKIDHLIDDEVYTIPPDGIARIRFLTALKKDVIQLDYELNEAMELIKRSSQILNLFKEYALKQGA